MTREEMIALANQAGMSNLSLIDIGYLEAFANLILEKAARICKLGELYTVDADYAVYKRGMDEAIRSLKV